jgi:hypothetical protein
MAPKFCKHLVVSIVLLLQIGGTVPVAHGRDKTIHVSGRAYFEEDGAPVPLGNILLLEVVQYFPGTMPALIPFDRYFTNLDGTFEMQIDRRKSIAIELLADRCDWLGVKRIFYRKDLKDKDELKVELVTSRVPCAEPGR